MKDKNPLQIYVYLLGEGVDVWRPVNATQVSETEYKIVSHTPSIEDEEWQFKPGEVVRCKERVFSDNKIYLVAYERASDENK